MLCAIATKTTGLKPGINEVIELTIKPFGSEEVTFRCAPSRPELYSDKAQELNGISTEVALQFPHKNELIDRVLNMFTDISAVGHNYKFDYDMIVGTFGTDFTYKLFGKNRAEDTMLLVLENDIKQESGVLFGGKGLDNVCRKLGITHKTKTAKIEAVYRFFGDGK